METKQQTLNKKADEIRLFAVKVDTLERVVKQREPSNTIALLTEKEKQRITAIGKSFSQNYFFGCASHNTGIDAQVYETLEAILDGTPTFLSQKQLKDWFEKIKTQDREEIKSPFIGWAVVTGLFGLILGISALVLYFFNPVEWIYPYGWMAVYEIAGAIIAPALLGVSAFIFKVIVDHKEAILKLKWEGLQNIVDNLTSKDIQLLQKINSPEWKETKESFEIVRNSSASTDEGDDLSTQSGQVLKTTPPSSDDCPKVVVTQKP